MNKAKRRKVEKNIDKLVSRFEKEDGTYRDDLTEIDRKFLEPIIDDLQDILDQEEGSMSNLEDANLDSTEMYFNMEDAVSSLEDAIDALQDEDICSAVNSLYDLI